MFADNEPVRARTDLKGGHRSLTLLGREFHAKSHNTEHASSGLLTSRPRFLFQIGRNPPPGRPAFDRRGFSCASTTRPAAVPQTRKANGSELQIQSLRNRTDVLNRNDKQSERIEQELRPINGSQSCRKSIELLWPR